MELVIVRAIVLLLGLNLADRLGILQDRLGSLPFLPLFNGLTLALTCVFLILWLADRNRLLQLYFQISADLILTTALVAYTRAIESPFVSFYILIVIYCSLTLGRNGGMVGAALSTILYAGIVAANHLGFIGQNDSGNNSLLATFRISAHVLGFWAVAYLGTYLHKRLRAIEDELKEKIDSLTQLQRLNEHIVSSIRSGLITTDLDGRIAVFNLAAQELTGRNAREMIGRPVHGLFGEIFWTRILHADLMTHARPLRHEEWISISDGQKRYLGFSVSPLLDQDQRLLGFIISFQDLTEIIRLEEEVRLKDRMAAIGRMAAGIAHEIRNPLTSMRGSVEILRSHSKFNGNDDRLLDILIRESDRLNKFIEDFLCFARPRQYAQQPIDLAAVLRDSVTLLKNNPEVKGKLSVILKVETEPLNIVGSTDQLNQVFWNLAQNSIRAMPDGGEIKIIVRKVSENIGEVVFQDDGIGITAEEREFIFQPFQSGFKGGLGLGLSIIFQIMEDHRGRIAFESEKNRGTRVTLRFPLETRKSEFEAAEPAALTA